MNELAPAGDRTGFAGWFRWLGFKQGQPPSRRWELQPVAIVSNESDLVSAGYGPRGMAGALLIPAANTFPTCRIVAGPSGVRVGVDVQSAQTGAANVAIGFRTFNGAADPALQALNLANLTPGTVPLIFPEDYTQPPLSQVLFGGTAATMGPASAVPVYNISDVTVRTNSFFHVGLRRMEPSLWLAPGVILDVASLAASTVGNSLALYLSVMLQEPGSARA